MREIPTSLTNSFVVVVVNSLVSESIIKQTNTHFKILSKYLAFTEFYLEKRLESVWVYLCGHITVFQKIKLRHDEIALLSPLRALCHLVLMTTLRDRQFYHLHFTVSKANT